MLCLMFNIGKGENKLLQDRIKDMPEVSTLRPFENQGKSQFVHNSSFV